MIRKAEERWGSGVVEQVSLDLQAEFPDADGFSASNLWYMKRWYLFYAEKLQQLVGEFSPDMKLAQIGKDAYDDMPSGVSFPVAFGYIPWGQHIAIISRCKSLEEAVFYIRQTIKEGLSRAELVRSIEADEFHIQGNAVTNFAETLPMPQAGLAQEMIKENYDFGFLSLPRKYSESQLEEALEDQLTRFLLELGTGFAFLGRQKEIVVGGKTRRIDMLFYHIKLRAYIVCELKVVPFEPEFAGKLNYYVSAVDELLKSESDNPTIGLLICSGFDKTDVKWAFRGVAAPLGVAKYSNVQIAEIQKQLPTAEDLAREIDEVRQRTFSGEGNKPEK